MTIEDIFKYSYCLTIDDARYQYQCDVFNHFGLPKPKKFQGLEKEPNGAVACLIGHLSLVMMARTLNLPYITIFEDDAYPCIDVVEELNYHLSNIPDNCGLLSYGYNGVAGNITADGDFEIFEERPFGSHAYTIFSDSYDEYILSLEKQRISDIAMRGNNFTISGKKPYWITKNLFIQKNINMNRMSESAKMYIYPCNNRRVGYFDYPADRFLHDIPGIAIPICKTKISSNERYYVEHYSWKGWCSIDLENGKIAHGSDHGTLTKIESGRWRIKWDRWNSVEDLVEHLDTYKIVRG